MADLYDITHGAGGLWEVHKWNDDLELNTQDDLNERYFVEAIDGLHSLPPRPNTSTPKVGRIGLNPRPSSPGGKTVVYRGEIVGDDLETLRALRTAMVSAFAVKTYGTMDLIPQYEPTYPAVDNSPTVRFYATVEYLDPPEEISSYVFKRTFTLGLELVDPRFYFLDLAVDETSIYPLSVTNPGSAPVDPIIRVPGASGTVEVSDGTRSLQFLNCPAGELVIDFLGRTATVSGAPVQLDVPNSDWWDSHVDGIAAEATVTITQTGGTGVQVQFIPATWA